MSPHRYYKAKKKMQNTAYILIGILFMGTLVASCSKEEPIVWSQSGERAIQFTVVQEDGFVEVEKASTKATEIKTATLAHFGVFASYLATGTFAGTAPSPAPDYMYNQKVAKNNTAWECTPARYWPTKGSLSFFAYAPFCNDNKLIAFSPSTKAGAPTLTYTTPQDVASQLDLLAAAPLYDQTIKSAALPVSFKHLLSSIEFSAIKEPTLGEIIKIQEITITGLKTKATYSYPTTGTGSWVLDATSPASNYVVSVAKGQLKDVELTNTAAVISSTDLVMPLPQAIPATTGTVTLSAKISYNKAGVIQTRTVSADLNPTISNLQMAKKYKVSLSIGSAAPQTVNIKLDCTVAEWTIQNITIPSFK
ncbi:MAG: fimbrillin family protein [Bacteroides sp.]